MSGFALKWLAMIAMLIDHAGLCFRELMLDEIYWLCRIVGRISMPIFCFHVAEGLYHTRNAGRYILRLALFAVVSEAPFDLVMTGDAVSFTQQNVGFTLLAGLCAILLFDIFAARGQRAAALAAVVAFGIAASLLHTDYGFFGVFYVFIFYCFRGNARIAGIGFLVGALLYASAAFMDGGNTKIFLVQCFAGLAIVPIWLYNGKKGRERRWTKLGFYLVYPVHLLVFYGLTMLM